MDWFASVRKQAQEAVNTVVNSEAAGLARQLAAQATEQATALAKEAKVKAQVQQMLSNRPAHFSCCSNVINNTCDQQQAAGWWHFTALRSSAVLWGDVSETALQEVAKEAIGEAEKSLKHLQQVTSNMTALQVSIDK